MRRGFNQVRQETAQRIRNAAAARDGSNAAIMHKKHRKNVKELIKEAQAVMNQGVMAGGRQGTVTGVDYRTGSPLITFKGSRKEEKFSIDSLTFL